MRATDGDDPELAQATQLRVQRSLEDRGRSRQRWLGVLVAGGILSAGTMSWALATGHVKLWSAAPSPVVAPEKSEPPARVASPRSAPAPVVTPDPIVAPPKAIVAPPVAALPPEAPPAPVHRAPPARPAPTLAPVVAPVEALYRHAHDLHFHGGDPSAALAAWDAYLAAEPAGRFSVDARYNRALMLVRLGRYAEARSALLPFAAGEVDASGYRQSEAQQIVDRLAHVVDR
jgi:hypothetical protein